MVTIRHFRELEKSKLNDQHYETIIGKRVNMISHLDQWTIRSIREDEVSHE